MRLSDLRPGETAVVTKVLGHGAFRKRIMEMGFVRGKTVSVILNAPLQDPVKYKIMDYEVSLRRREAEMIEVVSQNEAEQLIGQEGHMGSHTGTDNVQHAAHISGKTINIALVGNPNSGKTSLFNSASGQHEHVGNYGGVTVDAKKGSFHFNGYKFVIYDLPGTYSLSAYSPEEVYVRRHLFGMSPDVVVNVVAASNLERNLYLTTELIDMDVPAIIALNMYDELEGSGAELDYSLLGDLLGLPIIPTVSRSGRGLDQLFEGIIKIYENPETQLRHININHVPELENAIDILRDEIKLDEGVNKMFSPRYLAIKMLERDKEVERLLSRQDNFADWIELRDRQAETVEKRLDEDIETIVANDKYGFISGALKETFMPGEKEEVDSTRLIDTFVTHKLWGFPIFIFFMWLMFEATFSLGQYPMDWIGSGVEWIGAVLGSLMADGILKDLIIDGIIGGVGGVIVFLPNILILYLFISFMEDSGYMARAAFIMDRIMHKMGLHGKSFIPLIMGFGCNVPAIMATRSIESRSSRMITILINPFMSCSARLPVYLLLVGIFFPDHGGVVMMCLYLFGILMAVLTAKLLRKFYFKRDETPFVMELPPYRMPTARSTLIHMWDKAAQYLKKMGGIILVASIIVWFLSYFPREHAETTSLPINMDTTVQSDNITDSVPQRNEIPDPKSSSYMERIGQTITPVMEPLGFNWKTSVSLLTGMAAKEVIVSTLGVLYSESDADENSPQLRAKLIAPDPETGEPGMNTASALSFLVFVLLYFPCIAAMAAISRETGSWKWAAFSFIYNTSIAWIAALVVYNIAKLII